MADGRRRLYGVLPCPTSSEYDRVMQVPILDPTPYAGVNGVLRVLLSGARDVLGDRMVGLYLYGSLSSGDFNPHSSDLDFVVVTSDVLPDDTVAALEAIHQRLWAGSLTWAAKLEGAYVPQHVIRRRDDTAPPCPTVNEGKFYLARLGSDWVIQRHIIREQGRVLMGPPPQTLIDPVSPDELRDAVRGILREWWQPMIADPTPLHREGYQPFAILSMCRALYTLEHGSILSKPASARWALRALDARWRSLIERGLAAWQAGAPMDEIGEVQAFIGYVVEEMRWLG